MGACYLDWSGFECIKVFHIIIERQKESLMAWIGDKILYRSQLACQGMMEEISRGPFFLRILSLLSSLEIGCRKAGVFVGIGSKQRRLTFENVLNQSLVLNM